MRKQYHFRPSPAGLLAWDVDRLIVLAQGLAVQQLALADIAELDENYWFAEVTSVPSARALVEHMQLVQQCDLRWPIIVCPDGRVMDGMHRVCRALLQAQTRIAAVQLPQLPEPDFIGVMPDDLPY